MEIINSIEEIWNRYHSASNLIQMTEDWSKFNEESDILNNLHAQSEECLFMILNTQWFILTTNHRLEERNDFFYKYDILLDTKITYPAFKLWYLCILAIMIGETNSESLKSESMEKVISYASLVSKNILPPPSFSQYQHIETMLVLSNCYSHVFQSGRYVDAENCLQAQFNLSTGQNYNKGEFLLLKNVQFQLYIKEKKYPDALDAFKDTISTCGSNSLQRLTSIRSALFCLKTHLTDLEQNSQVVEEIIEIWNFIILTLPQSKLSSLATEKICYSSRDLKSKIVQFLKEIKSPYVADPNIDEIISKVRDRNPEFFDNSLES